MTKTARLRKHTSRNRKSNDEAVPTGKRTFSSAVKSLALSSAAQLREKLTLTQPQFARLLSTSVRTLVTLESGKIPTETLARRLTELERLTNSLSEVIRKDSLGQWLQTPNRSYNGSKPIEVIERGESDKLWEMIFLLRSGVPF